jgi:hypothetical protein
MTYRRSAASGAFIVVDSARRSAARRLQRPVSQLLQLRAFAAFVDHANDWSKYNLIVKSHLPLRFRHRPRA